MKKSALLLSLFTVVFSGESLAYNVKLNAPLPAVSVANDGEILANGNAIHYKNWQSSALVGKVRVVHHLAGRSSVKEKNQPLMDAIKNAGFDRSQYQTTTIINADDAIIGTGLFVKSSAEKGKLDNAHSQVILDQNSQVKKAWQLKEKESFITVLDKKGKVQFVAEGKLSPTQIQQVIELVKTLIAE